jgi:2,3-bisphosphoglycerate-dependent phosphoglycerate mutase
MKRLYLVRHCQALGQKPEADLTEIGKQQAVELAEYFSDKSIEYIISSPFLRAVNTIKPLSEMVNQEIECDVRLQERILCATPFENWMELLERTYLDFDLKFEGGESSNEALSRGMQVIQEMIQRPETNILAVTHGALLSLLIKHYRTCLQFFH